MNAISRPYVLAGIEHHSARTQVRVGRCVIGDGMPVVIAGPCAVETYDQLLTTARHLAPRGCHLLRGGAFKPRTSPYSFQGLGRQGLEFLVAARAATGLPVVTEVLAPGDVEMVAQHADMVQIGARSMQNFPLLREVGRLQKPVLLKRAPWATLAVWLQSAEYILAEGNIDVVLCERGICASEAASARHLDLPAILKLRQMTHLPVIVDPSHGTGDRSLVIPMALAALMIGADGVMVEVHPDPDRALSDGEQSLRLSDFDSLMQEIARLRAAGFLGSHAQVDDALSDHPGSDIWKRSGLAAPRSPEDAFSHGSLSAHPSSRANGQSCDGAADYRRTWGLARGVRE